MRSTHEIIMAVKEQQPVTEEELRMALLVEQGSTCFLKQTVRHLIDAMDKPAPVKAIWVKSAQDMLESVFKFGKGDPLTVLGPRNIPGTAEYARQFAISKAILAEVDAERAKKQA